MKLTKTVGGMELTDTPKTVTGVIFAVAAPIVLGSILAEWLSGGDSLSESWYIPAEMGVLFAVYVLWLCTDFRTRVMTYAYVFDRDGVREKRLIGAGKAIAWRDMEEYACEADGTWERSQTLMYRMVFTSSHPEKPVVIRTPRFREEQKQIFWDEIGSFCDAMRGGRGR